MAEARPSLRSGIIGVAGTGVGLFTFSMWTSRDVGEVATAAVSVMTVVSIVSISRMRRSAFWIGFVVVGWGWLAISLGSPLAPDLPQTAWIDAVRPPLGPSPNAIRPYDSWDKATERRRDQLDRDAYRTAGHCVVSMLLGCACGAAMRSLFAVDDRDPADLRVPDGSLLEPNPSELRDSP